MTSVFSRERSYVEILNGGRHFEDVLRSGTARTLAKAELDFVAQLSLRTIAGEMMGGEGHGFTDR